MHKIKSLLLEELVGEQLAAARYISCLTHGSLIVKLCGITLVAELAEEVMVPRKLGFGASIRAWEMIIFAAILATFLTHKCGTELSA